LAPLSKISARPSLCNTHVYKYLLPLTYLHEDGRAQVLGRVPPVAGTGGRTARAQDALVQAIQLLPEDGKSFLKWKKANQASRHSQAMQRVLQASDCFICGSFFSHK